MLDKDPTLKSRAQVISRRTRFHAAGTLDMLRPCLWPTPTMKMLFMPLIQESYGMLLLKLLSMRSRWRKLVSHEYSEGNVQISLKQQIG